MTNQWGLIHSPVSVIYISCFSDSKCPPAFYMTSTRIFSGHQTHPLSPAAPTKFFPFSLECDRHSARTASIHLWTDNHLAHGKDGCSLLSSYCCCIIFYPPLLLLFCIPPFISSEQAKARPY